MFNDALYLSIEKQNNSDIKLEERETKLIWHNVCH
jgi:hypothetical protein